MSFHTVVTTIQEPTTPIRRMAEAVKAYGGHTLVIGDRKGPDSFELENADFISIEEQVDLPFQLVRRLPENHYTRKNLGYLLAIQGGAERIFETDDDNYPLSGWSPKDLAQDSFEVVFTGWCNIYRYFSPENIWPRGFPLEKLCCDAPPLDGPLSKKADYPIQQLLANGSPDVDAVWRLVLDRKITFQDKGAVSLAKGTWCPFNSQATWWWPEAYPYLYLPSFCSFRMTDIWRSFVAQRCLWADGNKMLFHNACMFQERNEHDLIKDFRDEIDGYLNNSAIIKCLEEISLQEGKKTQNLMSCYEALVRKGFVPEAEIALVDAWCNDLARLGLNF